MATKKEKQIAQETIDLFMEFRNAERNTWAQQIQEDSNFRYGAQWTQNQIDTMKAKGAATLSVNRIHKAIETMKSMLTSNKPGFKVAPQGDSDNKTAIAIQGLMQYIWNISDGDEQLSICIDNMLGRSLGYLMPYIDPFSDDGMGDVKFKSIDPKYVYVDPNAQEIDFSDATDIIVSRVYTKKQLMQTYPQYKHIIKNATGVQIDDQVVTDNQASQYNVIFAGHSFNVNGKDNEDIRGYERYSKIMINRYRVRESYNKAENLYSEADFKAWGKTPIYIINGQPIREESVAKKLINQLMQEHQQQMQQYTQMQQQMQQAMQMGQLDPNTPMQPPPEPPSVEEHNNMDLVEIGFVEVIKVMVPRIKMSIVLGDTHIYTRIMEMSSYPIIPMPNIHTGSPFPISEVAMVKDSQKYLNWLRSLVIRHAQISTNLKVMVPAGGNDIEELRESWDSANAMIEVDMSEGSPVLAQPMPMPSELFISEDRAKMEIDDQIGVSNMSSGNPDNGPDSFRGILTIDEFGQRRAKVKLATVERSLTRLGKGLYALIREFYTAEKQFRILEPNRTYSEYIINKSTYSMQYENDESSVIETINDVSTGKYDIMFIPGSTLPDNRYAKFQMLLEAYKLELVDRVEVLKKTDIFDIDGVLSRIDTITNLEKQVDGMSQQIKELKGDMQTSQRELHHKDMEVAKVQEREKLREATMKHILSIQLSEKESQKVQELYKSRLDDILSRTSQEGRLELQRQKLQQQQQSMQQSQQPKAGEKPAE